MDRAQLEQIMKCDSKVFGVMADHAKELTDVDLTADDFTDLAHKHLGHMTPDAATDVIGFWFIAGATAALDKERRCHAKNTDHQ
jgi:hypothetical protein